MMKQIQWFPGHMFKSLRQIREKITLMDIVLVLLDSRLPSSSMNPEIFKIIKDKPTLILFNKMDLSDESILNEWVKFYEEKGYQVYRWYHVCAVVGPGGCLCRHNSIRAENPAFCD